MKKCPYCAEEIQDDAVKCRFCNEFLKKKWWKNCFFGCLIAFVASFLLTFLFIFLSFWIIRFVVFKIFFGGPSLPQYYPPFTGQGIEGILRDFAEVFRQLWERLKDFFHWGQQNYQGITF